MAQATRFTEGYRFSYYAPYHLFAAFLILATLNTREVTSGSIISLNASTDTIKDGVLIPHTKSQDRYEPYYIGMTSPLEDSDLEYSLDYYSEKAQMKEYDFDSTEIVKKLADSAMAHDTPPNQFMEEIHDLISLQNRSSNEPDENTARDELPLGVSDTLFKRVTEGWKNELKRLEKKYNVSSECASSDSVTATRLNLMFPHYLNFGQKPLAAPSEISLNMNGGSTYDPFGYTTTDSYNSYYKRRSPSTTPRYNSYSTEYKIPAIFKRPEFGGLIPRFLDLDQKILIGLHLYAMYGNDQNDAMPFRTKCVMLRRRMEKCVLSDKRRNRFLLNNGIFNSSNQSSLHTAYLNLPADFTRKIEWDLFDLSENSGV
nr:PREDICTED: uncharacterized protein LOC109030577 [Bemisia tabaci]